MTKEEFKFLKKEDMIISFSNLKDDYSNLFNDYNKALIELDKLRELRDANVDLQIENRKIKDELKLYKYSQESLIHENETYKTTFEVLKEKYKC